LGKYIAIDFGLKRTGLAITDASNMFAFGLETVDSSKLMSALITLVQKENVSKFILGDPKRLNGADNSITENVYLFKKALEKQFSFIEVILVDERFSSKMAFQTMIDGGLKKKQRRDKGLVDKISATIILQSYLEINNSF
jgi:putative Holliday junction resolvase